MTRILYLPNENAIYNLDSPLAPGLLTLAVNSGKWLPPPGLPRPEKPGCYLRAVRTGPDTILIFCPFDLELLSLPVMAGEPLAQRQMEVLQCVAQGMTVRQVAARLGMSRRTVYLHLAAIRRSLNAGSTTEAVRRAAELGLCQRPASRKSG